MQQAQAGPALATIDGSEAQAYNRRLADKILSAFNHAYAIGAGGIADSLRQALVQVQEQRAADAANDRRGGDYLEQAGLWVRFVDARNAYNDALARGETAPEGVQRLLAAMRAAYQRWSEG